jgi:hypothetical protein
MHGKLNASPQIAKWQEPAIIKTKTRRNRGPPQVGWAGATLCGPPERCII